MFEICLADKFGRVGKKLIPFPESGRFSGFISKWEISMAF